MERNAFLGVSADCKFPFHRNIDVVRPVNVQSFRFKGVPHRLRRSDRLCATFAVLFGACAFGFAIRFFLSILLYSGLLFTLACQRHSETTIARLFLTGALGNVFPRRTHRRLPFFELCHKSILSNALALSVNFLASFRRSVSRFLRFQMTAGSFSNPGMPKVAFFHQYSPHGLTMMLYFG